FPHSLAVSDFNGDGRADLVVANQVSNNLSVLLAIAPPPTSTTLLAAPSPSQFSSPVTLSATVSPSNASGSIEFLNGASVIGTASLNLAGSAQISSTLLPTGANSLRAIYNGAPGVWQASASVPVNQLVNATASSGLGPAVNYQTVTQPGFVD